MAAMTNHQPTEIDWLSHVLTEKIPLGRAMGLSVQRLDWQGVAFSMPLGPNVNDKGTAFGGAMASAMILAGWSLPRLLLKRENQEADLVIGRCEIRYLKPVKGGFDVECDWPEKSACDLFIADLVAKNRSRLPLEARVMVDGEVAATLSARYAALKRI